MTGTELKRLKMETQRGTTSIYKVARVLGRMPYAWEVIYFSPRRGRRQKYSGGIWMAYEKSEAIDMWKRIGDMCIKSDPHNTPVDYKKFVDGIIADKVVNLEGMCIAEWKKLLCDVPYSALTEYSKKKCIRLADDVMLEIIHGLRAIIYGG